ncbi:MAG: Na+/H+ antiporter subunit E [Anaerolineae bacterium]|nr:Na+/H+ antiporter subunit E [Anaerolineae bacterium]
MLFYLLVSLGFAVVWMIVTGQFNPGGFAVGWMISIGLLLVVRPHPRVIRASHLPRQMAATVIYILVLFRDIVLSSVDVARRALSRDMRLQPGIIAVPTQDPQRREIVTALSAHNITITPGEMVVDFDTENSVMYVHCLDVRQSIPIAEAAQSRRLRLLLNLLGDRS